MMHPLKHFRIQSILRILFLCFNIILLVITIPRTNTLAIPTLLGILAVYQVVSLVHYVEKISCDLTRFLESVKHSDFSQSFSSDLRGRTFQKLNEAFNDVIEAFQKARSEKEVQSRYLQTIVQHIGTGLIVFKKEGKVDIINSSAKKLLKLNQLKHIQDLNQCSTELMNVILDMKSGERKLVKYPDPYTEELISIAITSTEFIMQQKQYNLISLQNIQTELEEKEMEAWQNLIRVLTHEIMNSITPITSLASTAKKLITKQIHGLTESDEESLVDVHKAIDTIEKRGEGLLKFVDNYRKLTRIPNPDFQTITIEDLFKRIHTLMENELKGSNILFKTSIDPHKLQITGDPYLIEQVLINLVKNSLQALQNKKEGKIDLTAQIDGRGRTVIQVRDNGPGIQNEALDKIFIPFFTTKKQGSGIGLSVSKQIMRLHRGTLSAKSKSGKETIFTLKL